MIVRSRINPARAVARSSSWEVVSYQKVFGNQTMSQQQQQHREELDRKARQGDTIVPGRTGGKSLEAQEHLAEGNIYN